ncbi:MAG: pilus assembly protein PilP [Pedobacter sp.]
MTTNLLLNRSTYIALIALMIAALFTGCKKKEPPPFVAASKPVSQQPKPVQKSFSSSLNQPSQPVNNFDFSNKKDPFKPFAIVNATQRLSPESARQALRDALPIHSFDVGQFKLIGIVTGGKENKAMVTDPNGKGYVLRVGMAIGKNEGHVTAITNNGVDVVDQLRDDNGRVRKENIRLTLPRKQ